MKRYADEETAKSELKRINDESKALTGSIHSLVDKMGELSRFYRSQSSGDDYDYRTMTRLKNAGSDLTVLSRKLLGITSTLKHLISLKFPEMEIAEPKPKAVEKVNKNVVLERKQDDDGDF